MGERRDCPDCVHFFMIARGEIKCKRCNGSGEVNGKECRQCQGTGRVTCPKCKGTGYVGS